MYRNMGTKSFVEVYLVIFVRSLLLFKTAYCSKFYLLSVSEKTCELYIHWLRIYRSGIGHISHSDEFCQEIYMYLCADEPVLAMNRVMEDDETILMEGSVEEVGERVIVLSIVGKPIERFIIPDQK